MLLATALIPRLFSAMPLVFKVTSMGSFLWQMLHIVLVPWEGFLQSGRPRLKVPSPTLDGLPSTPSSLRMMQASKGENKTNDNVGEPGD